MASKGQIFDALLVSQQSGGVTLAGGKAYFYVPGTETLKAIYADRNKVTPAANPYTLSADGTAMVYGDGLYDVKITNSAGVQKFLWEDIQLTDGSENLTWITEYNSLSAAVSSIGSANKTLYIGTDQTLTGNLTIPSTLEIVPVNGATITTTGYTLTINSTTERWPKAQIFAGTGSVLGLGDTVDASWFGLGASDDILASVNKALAASSRLVTVPFSASYTLSNTLTVTSKMIDFNGSEIAYTGATGTWGMVVDVVAGNYRFGARNFTLTSTSVDTTNRTHGVNLGGSNGLISNFKVKGFTGISLGLGGGAESYTGVTMPATSQCYYWRISDYNIASTAGWNVVIKTTNNANLFTNTSTFPNNGFADAIPHAANCINEMVINGASNQFDRTSLEASPSGEKVLFLAASNQNIFTGPTYFEYNTSWAVPPFPRITAQAQSSANRVLDIRHPYSGGRPVNDLGTANEFIIQPANYINGLQLKPPFTSGNMVTNGNFASKTLSGWSDFSSGGWAVSYVTGYASPNAVRVDLTAGRVNITQDIVAITGVGIDALKGKTVTVGAWVKSNLTQVVQLRMASLTSNIASQDGSWSYVTTTVRIPDAATTALISVFTAANDTGYVEISDVTCVIGNNPLAWPMVQTFNAPQVISGATPSVAGNTFFTVTNGGATTITNFTNGKTGQEITLLFTDSNTTITDGANIKLSAAFVSTADDTMKLIYNGTAWFEVSRSVN
jgi:hypothetical protein